MVNVCEKMDKEDKKLTHASSSALHKSNSRAMWKSKQNGVDDVPMANPNALCPQPHPEYKGAKSSAEKDDVDPPASTKDPVVDVLSLNGHDIQAPEHMDAQGFFGSDNEDTAGIRRKWDGEEDTEDDTADGDEQGWIR